MRTCLALAALALTGCLSDPGSGATGSYSADPTVTSSRAAAGFITRGTPLRSWVVRFISADSCDSPVLASFEIDLAASVAVPPLGDIPFRTTEAPSDLPSALMTAGPAMVVSGTVTITSAQDTKLEGSVTAQVMLNGAPATLSAAFGATTCP